MIGRVFPILPLSLAASILLFAQSCSESSFSSSSTKSKYATEAAVFAVRDLGCALCHAKVDSNIITDFNFDRDELTQHQAMASMLNTLTDPTRPVSIKGDVIIPKTEIKHSTGATALIEGENAAKGHCLADVHMDSAEKLTSTRSVNLLEAMRRCIEPHFTWGPESKKFREVAKVEITPPHSASEIIEIATRKGIIMAAGELKALPSHDAADPKAKQVPGTQSGFVASATSLRLSDEISCDGAHIYDGPVVIDNAKIRTTKGCRIYATGSIFVRNNLEVKNSAPSDAPDVAALQLMSAIYIGFHVEPSIMEARLNHDYVKNRSFRGGTGAELTAKIKADMAKAGYAALTAQEISAADTISYKRIAASAPVVYGRNKGEFFGAIVAEHYIGRIDALTFTFDPVLERVPFFPELGKKIVKIEN
jgi:hypothetical protein